MARNICLPSALVLGVGLAVAAPAAALAAPVDEIVVDAVPAGTERIIVDLEGAPAATSALALRWRDDDPLMPLSLGATPYGQSAVITPVASARVGVQVSTQADSASLALTFVDAAGAVIGQTRHELPADGGGSGGGFPFIAPIIHEVKIGQQDIHRRAIINHLILRQLALFLGMNDAPPLLHHRLGIQKIGQKKNHKGHIVIQGQPPEIAKLPL